MSEEMPAHKFAVGQKVRFTPELGQTFQRGETFIVVRLLPETSGVLQYQIRSEMDGHGCVCGKPSSPISRQSPPERCKP
jgi:hypothetical protein